MQESTESTSGVEKDICDALRYLGEVSYAILPRDMAHALGDLEKSFWNNVRTFADKELGWIDERVAGSDRRRQDWQQRCNRKETGEAPEPIS